MTPFMIRKSFDDFDVFAEQIRGWNVDFLQLKPGPFAAEVSQYASPRLQLMLGRSHVHLEQHGSPPAGYRTFVVPMNPEMRLHWRATEVDGSCLLVFPSGSDLYAVSRPDFDVCTLSIQEEWLDEKAIALELPPSATILDKREVLVLSPGTIGRLRMVIRTACHQLISAKLGPSEYSLLEESIASAILHAVAGASDLRPRSKQRCRETGLQRALAYLEEHERELTTVTELARVAGVSQRSLEYAFLDRFDLSPKRYLTTRRMFGIRRELRIAPLESRIQDVALSWGFFHPGQFAVDYRKWFHERPSETRVLRIHE
ncbi:hypothetical protein DRQ53_07295 [bacterium]|nr:MAG: hypothetical protein DRQ53_07295 [bacterium]